MVEKTPESAEDEAVEPAAEDAMEASAGSDGLPEDPEQLRAEVERLRAENERLASGGAPPSFWRNAGAGVLITIGVLLFSMAIAAVWLNRTVMDENRWVDTVAPLAQNVAIQDYVANSASNAIFNAVDIQSYVNQALAKLPPQAQILSAPITGAVQNFIRDAARKFTHSDKFAELWVSMNRLAHKAFIASITERTGKIVNNQNGQITLDVSMLVDQVKQALVARGLTFVNNISIPISQEQIVLYSSANLAALGSAIQLMNALAYVLPLLAILLLGGGVALAANRQKAVLWLGIGVVVATLLPLEAVYLGLTPFTKVAYSLGQMPTDAAQAAYTIVFRYLVAAEQIAVALGLVFIIGAMVMGPSRWATSLRGGLQKGLNNVGPEWDFGPLGEWVYQHAAGLRTTGVIVAIASLLVLPTKSIAAIVWAVVLVLVWLLLIALFGRPRPGNRDQSVAGTDDESGAAQAS